MAALLGNMASWITGVPPDDGPSEQITIGEKEENETVSTKQKESDNEADTVPVTIENPTSTPADKDAVDPETTEQKTTDTSEHQQTDSESKVLPNIDIDIDEMSEKALSAAKEWGSFLFSAGKAATKQVTQQVVQTATQLKNTVEEKTFMGDFSRQQEQFVNENAEKKKKNEVAVPPWVGYNEEDAMRSQIMALSSDKRNFMRNPPAGVQFNFDFEASFPVASVMLQEDNQLKAMRFELVPKQLKENVFWRNYFYRVSLIKQSAQLTSLAQQSGITGEHAKAPSRLAGQTKESQEESTKEPTKKENEGSERLEEAEEMPVGSPPDNEFISDSFQHSSLDAEEMKKEMQQLGMTEEEIPEWEKELQAELQEYEVVNDGNPLDEDEDLEQEILQQIEAEANGAP